MSKTHTGDVTNAAKRIARWLVDKAKGAGHPTTGAELVGRVEATCQKFSPEDRVAIAKTAMVLFKQKDPEGHARMNVAGMEGLEVQDSQGNAVFAAPEGYYEDWERVAEAIIQRVNIGMK